MRRRRSILITAMLLAVTMAAGCGTKVTQEQAQSGETGSYEGVEIVLSDEDIMVDGKNASTDSADAVYTGADIIYYKAGQGDTYGEGTKEDEHEAEEAAKHTVVTITQPGTYIVSGRLSYGQLAVDLGKDAKKDEKAVVNLVLNNADITCSVAPAVIAYRVYECGSDDEDTASKDVDTSGVGLNLILADDSDNTVTGSHVAKIYKEGTTAEDIAEGKAKKAHKYDGAIESQMSFNINTGEAGNGRLTVNADNEGIETRLHMTINGGSITVNANDDSLNAGEDSVSVITINDGVIICDSGAGDGREGDGIDSNGWIVINGGYIIACANAESLDSGVDSDLGIYINGGTLLASGHMYDEVSAESEQSFMVLSFQEDVTEEEIILIADAKDRAIAAFSAVNDYSTVVYSSPDLEEGDYHLYKASSVTGDLKGSIYTNITDYTETAALQYSSNSMGGRGPGGPQSGKPEDSVGGEPGGSQGGKPGGPQDGKSGPPPEEPERAEKGNGERPERAPEEKPEIDRPAMGSAQTMEEPSMLFSLTADQFQFGAIAELEEKE